MQSHHRRIIFIVFLALFAVTAPLLILYTSGYRYNWQRGKVQETGVLLANYRPADARMTIEEVQKTVTKTPARFTGLLPSRYTIRLARDGYRAWEKRLWIEPSKTTFAEHMILWKEQPTIAPVTENALLLVVASPTNHAIAIVTKDDPSRFSLLDTKTNTMIAVSAPLTQSGAITQLLWSPNGRRLFIEWANRAQAIFLVEGTQVIATPLDRLTKTPLETVQWNANDDDRVYGYRRAVAPSRGYMLLEIDLFRGTIQEAVLPSLSEKYPYMVEDGILYRVEKGTLIITTFQASRRALERRLPLPDATTSALQFLPGGPDAVLTLFDAKTQRVLLIDKATRTLYPIQETIDGVIDAQWSPKHDRLLWKSGKVLWLLDLQRSVRERLREEKQKIHAMAWDPENEYVFYATDTSINVIEIDNRDKRNQAPLATIPEAKGLIVSGDGNTIYVKGRVNNNENLYAITVTER